MSLPISQTQQYQTQVCNVDTCNLACTYCWREPHSDTLTKIDDDPYELFLESVRAHRRLLTGYGGNPKADREKWLDAQNPKHVAISLNGEPTLYSRLGEFLEICHQHGVSTFLVTNGSLPKVIEELDPLPTQLYVSVDCLLYTSPSPRDVEESRMPSSA